MMVTVRHVGQGNLTNLATFWWWLPKPTGLCDLLSLFSTFLCVLSASEGIGGR